MNFNFIFYLIRAEENSALIFLNDPKYSIRKYRLEMLPKFCKFADIIFKPLC